MLLAIYRFFLPFIVVAVRVAAIFNSKLRRGLDGRKNLLPETRKHYDETKITGPRVLIHVASFGELEQAKPVIAAIKKNHPSSHIHVTFFSPSGYENAIGKYLDSDLLSYAPIDTRSSVSEFLDSVRPSIALFARYDVWPNMADALSRRKVPSILFAASVSGTAGRRIPFVKEFYGGVLRNLTKILVIAAEDKTRIEEYGASRGNVVVAGDTRFDQVIARRSALDAVGEPLVPKRILYKARERGTLVFIVGSSWESDEAVYLDALKKSIEREDNILTIIAPHEPSETRVRGLLSHFPGKAIRYSAIEEWAGEPVIIVDSIGKLFGLYRYADIAMLGGGFGAGLHNILEAAVWGVPAIVGPKHKKSREVQQLVDRLGAFEISNKLEFDFVFWRLAQSEDLRRSAGEQALQFVEENRGATERIMKEIVPLLFKEGAGGGYDRS